MAEIELKNITHIYEGGTKAVEDVSWKIKDGSANALLGPSGCGKTTLMKIISGLLKPTDGRVLFDGQDVTNLSPQERDICMVFQFPVVYRMSVYDNLAFPLRNMKVPEKIIKEKVMEVIDFLGLREKINTPADRLGPGDKQKVSLGRALVREEPNAILLDEPMTNIEPERRTELRSILKEIQGKLRITMILVTHDQTEALTFADMIAVMNKGKIIQYDTKEELFLNPKNTFVGYFIGSPGMNFLNCSLSKGKLDFGEFTLEISEEIRSLIKQKGTEFQIGIRPEHVLVSRSKRENWIKFKCELIEFHGDALIANLYKGGVKIKSRLPRNFKISEGDDVWIDFPIDKIKIYGTNGELLI